MENQNNAAHVVTDVGLPELRDALKAACLSGEPITLSHLSAGALYYAMTTPPVPGPASETMQEARASLDEAMASDELRQLKAEAQALAADGANWSMHVGCKFFLAMIERIESLTAAQPAGYIASADVVKLGNCRAELWAAPPAAGAVAVYFGAPPASADVCAEMRALCSNCGGTGDVHRVDGEWVGECNCALAVAQRDAARHERLFLAACGDLGLVSEALGLDPDDGGAVPIIEAIKALQAGVPAGWKAVPIDPTEDMVVDGFESVPDRHFDGDDYPEEYDAMSGCQQAAFRAKRCWAAMLEAAPAAGSAA